MKKYISILLCFALTVSIMCPVNVYAVDVSPASVVVEAQQTLTELDVTQPITKDTWGEPTIHVDKNSANTTLASWNGQEVEDVEMDLYFRWDKDYLYVGVVSADSHYKQGVMYDGDGIQLRINLGTERTYDSEKSILLTCTYNANEAVVVNANMNTADEKGYKTGIQCIDGVMYVDVAIPLIEFGLSEAEVKAGLAFSYSMIRQSATKDYNYKGHSWEDPHPRSLTGWLAWGIHFEDNGGEASKRALNVNCTTDNVIVLSDKVAQTGTVIRANKAYNDVDLENIKSWGTPAIHVDKNSYNTSLKNYEGTAEDVYMDIYTIWDDEYLYVGVISEDENLRGWDVAGKDNKYKGDGIQFGLSNGSTVQAREQVMVYLTFKGTDASDTYINNSDYAYSLTYSEEEKKMYAAVRIPLKDEKLAFIAEDIKAGLTLDFSILRISATADNEYEGWLAWGAYFGAGDDYNLKSSCDNKIVLSNDIADMATVVKADKVVGNIDINDVTSWGKPTIHVDKNSYNAVLFEYNAPPEDTDMDLYFRWDSEYLYIGVVSTDEYLRGWKSDKYHDKGDGIQFGLSNGSTAQARNQVDFYMNFKGKRPEEPYEIYVREGFGYEEWDHSLTYSKEDKKMSAAVRVPLSTLGFMTSDVKAGVALDFSILRVSATEADRYAGWLAWGAFFGANAANNPGLKCDNVIVLSDDVATTATTITSDKATDKVSLNDIKSWGAPAIHVDKNSYNTSLKNYEGTAEDVYMDIYTTWDGKYIYIGVISNDEDLNGDSAYYKGDGLQFGLSKGTVNKARDQFDICLTFDKDVSADAILYVTNNFAKEEEGEDKHPTYAHSLTYSEEDKLFYAAVQIPLEDLEFMEEDIKAGLTLDFSILRLSATKDNTYAGWLAWGAFFGAGDDYNLKSSCDNKIVLIDSNAVNITESEEVDEFKSLLLNLKDSSGTTVSTDGMNFEFGDSSAHKILTTENGTYVVYLSNSNVVVYEDKVKNSEGDYVVVGTESAVNEFTLVKIADGKATELGYGYVYGGLVDLVADNDGNVYVVGGSSSYTMDKLTKQNNGAEKAVLNIFKYDAKTGIINGLKAYRGFTNEADHHTFLSATTDMANSKIYTVFMGTSADGKYTDIEYFTYDIETSKWAKESTAHKVNITNITNSAVFALEDGVGFVYSDGKEIHYFNAKGVEAKIDAANLEDIYMDENGNVKILCGETLNVVTINPNGAVSTEVIVSDVASEGYTFRFAQIGSKRYIVAIDAENAEVNAANVLLYSDTFELISNTKLDKIIKYTSSFMVADDLAEGAENVTILFAGARGKVKSWYTAQLSVVPAAEEETPEVTE